jgi:Ribbon-helix-helix protein, copG family
VGFIQACLPGAASPDQFRYTISVMASDEQIQKWADEAEAGYDVDALKRRGRGRPGRGAEPMQVVAVRLTAEELDALDAAASKKQMSRSEAIRAALAHFAA